jgi:hypothetical protein
MDDGVAACQQLEACLEWKESQDSLWDRYIRKELDSEEYCNLSLGLGPDPCMV